MAMTFLSDWNDCYSATVELLMSDDPIFLARIGGSDTFVVAEYLEAKMKGNNEYSTVLKWQHLVERYNGYYDRERLDTNYLLYCETLLASYFESGHLIFCNHQLLSMYFRGNIHPSIAEKPIENEGALRNLISTIERNETSKFEKILCYPYPYVERLTRDSWTLFGALSLSLQKKKVLVISPFARSIVSNFHNRYNFFKNYNYPDFEILVYNTPVTYTGLPDNFYPDENWHGSLARMKSEISKLDFDVALLACGSYALPLGVHIQNELMRKAIYVGGVLQMYFGILGRRYDNSFFTDQINRDYFIWPLERDDFGQHLKVTEHTAHEALGAYF